MWRQRNFARNSDSDDQSISDEEELSGNLGENKVSFCVNVEENEPLQLQSRLEMLRGNDRVHSESNVGIPEVESTCQNETSVFEEDEVEMPDFPEEDGFTDDLIVSIDENSCAIAKHSATTDAKRYHKDNHAIIYRCAEQDEAHAWSAAHKEAETLICMNYNTSPSSGFGKANECRKGIMGKVKPKFSFQFQSHNKGGPFKSFISKDDDNDYTSDEFSDLHGKLGGNLMQQEDSNGKDEQQHENVKAVGHSFVEHSMAEILDCLQDRNNTPRRISKMSCRTRESRGKLVVKESASLIEKTAIADEDRLELVSSGSSSDDNAYDQNTKLSGFEMKKQTMADRFHNALAATLNNEGDVFMVPKQSCLGLFGKLQQVMQREKDHDSDFLKKLQNEAIPMSESHFIVVKILSRYLEAKLTVCHCFSVENMEACGQGSKWFQNSKPVIKNGRKRRVIFNPRICSGVELEVGNLIRIHYPWKEIQLEDNDETVVLSAYFSQIFS